MANVLGSLYVELKANTASFVDGMSKSAYVAKQAGRDIERSFSSLGQIAAAALEPLGPIAQQFSGVLETVGKSAGRAFTGLANMKGGADALKVAGGASVAAVAALDAAAIAMALHTTESAAKLYDQAQAAGVTTEALSGLSFVARQAGVDQGTLATALEKMAKSAFAAATAPAGTINAFTRLGVSVKDTDGKLRSSEAVFADLAGRFAALPNGIQKSALAIEVFGKAGAGMIPVLNEGREGIEKWLATAKRFGAVITDDVGRQAKEFEDTVEEIKIVFEGFAVQLASQLLPTLQLVATALKQAFDNPELVSAWATNIKKIVVASIELVDSFYTIAKVANATVNLVFSPTKIKEYIQYVREADAANREFIRSLESGPKLDIASGLAAGHAFAQRSRPAGGTDDLEAQAADQHQAAITKVVAALRAQRDAEVGSAAAVGESVAAQRLATAAGEAGAIVSRLLADTEKATSAERARLIGIIRSETSAIRALTAEKLVAHDTTSLDQDLQKESRGFDAQITSLQRLAQAYTTGGGAIAEAGVDKALETSRQHVAELAEELRLLSGIGGVSAETLAKLRAALDEANARLKQSKTQLLDIGALDVEVKVRADTRDLETSLASARALASAFDRGGPSVAAAQIDEQLAAERQRVADLSSAYANLSTAENADQAALAALKSALEQANVALEARRTTLEALRSANYDVEINKEADALRGEVPLLAAINRAHLQSADAVRSAEVALTAYNWQLAHPGASPEQIAAVTAQFKQQADEQYAAALSQEAAQYSLNVQYNDEITKLSRIREILQSVGQSTILVDAAIYDANRRVIEQWDAAAIKVGTLNEKLQAFFNEAVLAGQNAGAKIFSAFGTALDGLSDKLAEFVVTGKVKFGDLFENLGKSIVKAEFQDIIGKAAGGIGNLLGFKIPGLGPKRDGATASTALFVTQVGSGGQDPNQAIGSGLQGVFDSISGRLDGDFNDITGNINDSFHGINRELDGTFNSINGALAGTFNNILRAFSGGGGGGILGTVLGVVGSVFGHLGGGGGAIGDFGGSIPTDVFSGGTGIVFAAGGADVQAGQPMVVGEDGPEFFVPKSSGSVLPHGVSPGGIVFIQNIDARGADPGSEQRLRAAAKEIHDQSVLDAFNLVQQHALRTA